MSIVNQKKWTITAVIGLAYWLFGNLYEEIVFSPNWIMNSQVQLKRLNEFFVNTSPTIYFVPVTQIVTLLVWILSGILQITSWQNLRFTRRGRQ
jgi:hypothetical protein